MKLQPVKRPYALACPYCAQDVEIDGARDIRWSSSVDGVVTVEVEFLGMHRCTSNKPAGA